MRTWAQVGQALKERRRKLGLTQVQVVQAAGEGLSLSSLQNIENGRATGMKPRTRQALARALAGPPTAVDQLLEGEEPWAAPKAVDIGVDLAALVERVEGLETRVGALEVRAEAAGHTALDVVLDSGVVIELLKSNALQPRARALTDQEVEQEVAQLRVDMAAKGTRDPGTEHDTVTNIDRARKKLSPKEST
jgi:transcriptional regulator with XRE-family HTH domain